MPTFAEAAWTAYFAAAVDDDIRSSGYPVEEWFWNGPTNPVKAIADWQEKGPVLVQQFIDWFEGSGYEVWVTPDGRPAIELDLTVMFGSVPVKVVIDAILVNENGLCVWDWKTGAKKPDQWQQQGIYCSAVELAYGIRPLWAAYYMARGYGGTKEHPEKTKYVLGPMPMDGPQFSIQTFTDQFEAMERGINAGAFVARVGADCARCTVADYCPAVGGALSNHS